MDGEFSPARALFSSHARLLQKYEELENEIKQLVGMDLHCLKVRFASGWTLEPPKENVALEKLSDIGEWPCENTT